MGPTGIALTRLAEEVNSIMWIAGLVIALILALFVILFLAVAVHNLAMQLMASQRELDELRDLIDPPATNQGKQP